MCVCARRGPVEAAQDAAGDQGGRDVPRADHLLRAARDRRRPQVHPAVLPRPAQRCSCSKAMATVHTL